MAISDLRSGNFRLRLLSFLIIVLVISGHATMATAADTAQQKVQSILKDSLKTLWTDREFSPELRRRQQTLKTILATGTVNNSELETMMEKAFFSLLDHQKTSRYILKTFPERASDVCSPSMDKNAVEKAMWRALSSVIKKDDPLLFKAGTLAPPGTPWISVAETVLFPRIYALSDGKIQMKIYGGGAMGEDTEVLMKMDDGLLDSCGCTAIGVLAAYPDASALLLPGLFNNYKEVDYIYDKFRKKLDEGFEKHGYILAALIDTGFFYMFSKSGITSLEALKKHKALTWFGTIETSLYEELGINNARPVGVSEIVSALNTALADAVLAPAAWMLGIQAYQYANFYLKPPLFYSPGAVLVSTRTKDRLQKQVGISATFAYNIQEIIVSEFNAIEPEWKSRLRSYEEKSMKAFETKCGMQAITFSPEDQEIIRKAGNAVYQKLAGKVFPTDLTGDMLKALSEYRATH